MATHNDSQPGSKRNRSSGLDSGRASDEDVTRASGETDVTIPPRGNLSDASNDVLHSSDVASIPLEFDGYELIEEIARGGMGIVYRTYQKSLDRVVALKTLLAGSLASEDTIRLLRTEARAAGKLNHPGIVPVYDVGECHGFHYFTMPLIDGVSLGDRVARGPIDPDEAARFMKSAAETIHFAHEHNVIHRDLKPGNILVDAHDLPLITDFGIARRIEDEQTPGDVHSLMGTAEYMPPEQVSGEPAGPLADVYSLGATLYCLLTGRPPYQSHNTLDTLLAVLQGNPVPPRRLNDRIPRDLELVCLKCLEKRPLARYRSARELAQELGRFLEGEPVLVHPVGNIGTFIRWMRREPRNAAITTGLVTCFTAALAISGYYNFELNKQRSIAETARIKAELAEESAVLSERRTVRYQKVTERLLAEKLTAESGIVEALQYSIFGDVCSAAIKLSRAETQNQHDQALVTFRQSRSRFTGDQESRLHPLLDQIEMSAEQYNDNRDAIRDSAEQLITRVRQLWLAATEESAQVTRIIRDVLYSRTIELVDEITAANDRRDVHRSIESLLDVVNAELFVVAADEVYLEGVKLVVALNEWKSGPPPDALKAIAADLRQRVGEL